MRKILKYTVLVSVALTVVALVLHMATFRVFYHEIYYEFIARYNPAEYVAGIFLIGILAAVVIELNKWRRRQ